MTRKVLEPGRLIAGTWQVDRCNGPQGPGTWQADRRNDPEGPGTWQVDCSNDPQGRLHEKMISVS